MSALLVFQLQSGAFKENITVDRPEISLRDLREKAVKFINEKYPNHGLGEGLGDHLLFYFHDLRSINILQLITTAADICDGALVEVVISSAPQQERLVVHPHTLYVHSYKAPTFCDFCGEMLFGLVKQGLKCQGIETEPLFHKGVYSKWKCEAADNLGCGLNYHKRCASKVPNNCSGDRQRRPSAIPLSPRNSNTFATSTPSLQPLGIRLSTSIAATTSPILNLTTTTSSAIPSTPGPRTPGITTTPDIVLSGDGTSTSDNDPFSLSSGGASLLSPMPRKDRSSSWSGRPLWMEVADATRIKVPHTFQVHSYTRPTVCQHCKKLLKGLIRQGQQCRDCKYNCHKKCSPHVPKECPGNISKSPSFFVGQESGFQDSCLGTSSDTLSMNSVSLDDRDPDADELGGDLPSPLRPMPSAPPVSGGRSGAESLEDGEDGGESLNDSQNIPLMRIVMSKKQTKRPGHKILKEGWVVHYTNKNSMRKKHYWRLDTKAILMYQDETSSRYYKELPLNDILDIRTSSVEPQPPPDPSASKKASSPAPDTHSTAKRELTHFFEIQSAAGVFFIGSATSTETEAMQWQAAIRQALMPVTPQSSTGSHASQMAQLKVPIPGDSRGQLGARIQSEQEFSQIYQIFADEILGSGQFGTVYGAIRRKGGTHVAVKVIDKSKFPSSKEDALRVEVEILQKVRHPGVVSFEQMLETPDRIFVVMEKLKGDMLEMILSSEKGRLSERITQVLIQQVKLCDFGFARIIGERSFRRSVVGTPAYLAPEVLRNKGFNRSLDMWSVGVIVYVSLSGTFPFNEDEDINDQIQNAEFMYPPTPWKEITMEAVDFINSLLQVKMSKRLTVHKSLAHVWLQGYQLWSDLRCLEKDMGGERWLSHESDDARWTDYEKTHAITPRY